MIIKKNVIYQKDRRIRLPEQVENNLDWIGGITNIDILIERNRIIIQKSKETKPNNYGRKESKIWNF